MTPAPRQLLQTRSQRLAYVADLIRLKAGGARTQLIIYGLVPAVGGTNTKFQLPAGDVFLAQALSSIAASGDVILDTGATTAAGAFRKVAIDVKSDGTVVQTVGAVAGTQAAAVLPQTPADSITVGWLEIPASFTAGTTAVTTGMCKAMPQDNGIAQ